MKLLLLLTACICSSSAFVFTFSSPSCALLGSATQTSKQIQIALYCGGPYTRCPTDVTICNVSVFPDATDWQPWTSVTTLSVPDMPTTSKTCLRDYFNVLAMNGSSFLPNEPASSCLTVHDFSLTMSAQRETSLVPSPYMPFPPTNGPFHFVIVIVPSTRDIQGFSAVIDATEPLEWLHTVQPLYEIYSATNGVNWNRNARWNSVYSPCVWVGIACRTPSLFERPTLESLNLASNNLVTNTLQQISNLCAFNPPLMNIDVSFNDFGGAPFLPSFGNCTTLQGLRLQFANIRGPLPPDMIRMKSLEFLNASSNAIGGAVPTVLFQNMSSLKRVYLSNASLTGTIPEVFGNFLEISLSNNDIEGTIPATLFSSSPGLKTIELHVNNLVGEIPSELSMCSALIVINLSINRVRGILPSNILNGMASLRYVDFSQNVLQGSLPELDGAWSIDEVFLFSNLFSGTVPQTWKGFSVRQLRLQRCNLTGPLPLFFGDLVRLENFQIHDNFLSGNASHSLKPALLRQLYLKGNRFSGNFEIPDGHGTSLEVLYVNNNRFTGALPDFWSGKFPRLMYSYFAENSWQCGAFNTAFCPTSWVDCPVTECYNHSISAKWVPVSSGFVEGVLVRPLAVLVDLTVFPFPSPSGVIVSFYSKSGIPVVSNAQYKNESTNALNSVTNIQCCDTICAFKRVTFSRSVYKISLDPLFGGNISDLVVSVKDASATVVAVSEVDLPFVSVFVNVTILALRPDSILVSENQFDVIHRMHIPFVGITVSCIHVPVNGSTVFFTATFVSSAILRCSRDAKSPMWPSSGNVFVQGTDASGSVRYKSNTAPFRIVGTEDVVSIKEPAKVVRSAPSVNAIFEVFFSDSGGNTVRNVNQLHMITVQLLNVSLKNFLFRTSITNTFSSSLELKLMLFDPRIGSVLFSAESPELRAGMFALKVLAGNPHTMKVEVAPGYIAGQTFSGGVFLLLDHAGNEVHAYDMPETVTMRARLLSFPFHANSSIVQTETADLVTRLDFRSMKLHVIQGVSYSLEFTLDQKWAIPSITVNVSVPTCKEFEYAELFSDDCISCPVGLICNGTLNTTVQTGYWRPNKFTMATIACKKGVCLGTVGNLDSACEFGTTGPECGTCEKPFETGFLEEPCRMCENTGMTFLRLCGVILGTAFAGGVVIAAFLPDRIGTGDTSKAQVLVRMLLDHLQTAALIRSIQVEWKPFMSSFYAIMDWASSIDTSMYDVRCMSSSVFGLYQRFTLWSCSPLIMVAVSALGTSAVYLWRRYVNTQASLNPTVSHQAVYARGPAEICDYCGNEFAVNFCGSCAIDMKMKFFCESCDKFVHIESSRSSHFRIEIRFKRIAECIVTQEPLRYIQLLTLFTVSLLVMIFFVYPNAMSEISGALPCDEYTETQVEGFTLANNVHSYAHRDVTIDCNTEKHQAYSTGSYVLFVLYGVVFPFGLTTFMFLNKHRHDDRSFLDLFGFLYSGLTKRNVYWEMAVLIRKALFVFVVAISGQLRLRVYFCIWVLGAFLIANVYRKPYRYYGTMQSLSLSSQVLTLNFVLMMRPIYNAADAGQDIMIIYISIVNSAVVLLFLWKIISSFKREIAFQWFGNPAESINVLTLGKEVCTWAWKLHFEDEKRYIWTYLRETSADKEKISRRMHTLARSGIDKLRDSAITEHRRDQPSEEDHPREFSTEKSYEPPSISEVFLPPMSPTRISVNLRQVIQQQRQEIISSPQRKIIQRIPSDALTMVSGITGPHPSSEHIDWHSMTSMCDDIELYVRKMK